jgi:hypothetical protein
MKIKFTLKNYLIFLFFALPAASICQDFDQMYNLYQQKNMSELYKMVGNNSSNAPEVVFFKATFIENGAEALNVYEKLFSGAQGKLKSLVADKISQYYYAKGYYVKAANYAQYVNAEISDTKVVTKPPPALQPKKIYHIQVGAFGYQDNANRMRELLAEKKINSDVKIRRVNGKTLYCVWVHGMATYRQTASYAKELKAKYKLNYQIINP